MNLLDSIVWFILVALVLSVSTNYIGSITNVSYIAQSNFESTSILEKTELVLRHNLSSIIVDKNKSWYKTIYKDLFIEQTFEGANINLNSSVKELNNYLCYNYSINDLKLNIYKEVDINTAIDFYWDYIQTDEDWENEWTEFINIICLYSTYNYLNAGNIINTDNAPLSYVIYNLYLDLKLNEKILEKKWILYFN